MELVAWVIFFIVIFFLLGRFLFKSWAAALILTGAMISLASLVSLPVSSSFLVRWQENLLLVAVIVGLVTIGIGIFVRKKSKQKS